MYQFGHFGNWILANFQNTQGRPTFGMKVTSVKFQRNQATSPGWLHWGSPEQEKSSNTWCAWCQEVIYTPDLATWTEEIPAGFDNTYLRPQFADVLSSVWGTGERPEAAYGQGHDAWTGAALAVHTVSGTGCWHGQSRWRRQCWKDEPQRKP